MNHLTVCVLLMHVIITLGAGFKVSVNVTSLGPFGTVFDGVGANYYTLAGVDASYAKFLGIRYGEAPTGPKRFQKPSKYLYNDQSGSESEVVDATKNGYVCPQNRFRNTLITKADVESEDCLFLNVYVPLDNATRSRAAGKTGQVLTLRSVPLKAVYIFIHGGVFIRGSSNLFDASVFAGRSDIIVVTLNYRLGLLGFLTTDDDVMRANLGLWDQQLAIQWVSDNIHAFGGDKTRITVGGQSAGSFSSMLQSFHEGNDDLFQNTIAESGSPLSQGIVGEKGLPTTKSFAMAAGCRGDELASSKGIRDCFMKLNFTEIVTLRALGTVGPVLDEDFISKESFKYFPQQFQKFKLPLSSHASFSKKNLLLGTNAHDGEIVYELLVKRFFGQQPKKYAQLMKEPVSQETFLLMLGGMLNRNNDVGNVTKVAMVATVAEEYIDWKKPSDAVARSYSLFRVMTDVSFLVPNLNSALLHSLPSTDANTTTSERGNTFLYEFSLPLNSPIAKTTDGTLPWFRGTSHGKELYLMYAPPAKQILLLFAGVGGLETIVMKRWSNFVKYSDPNPPGLTAANATYWQEYTSASQAIYQLSTDPKTLTNVYAKTAHFWNQYLPNLEFYLQQAVAQ